MADVFADNHSRERVPDKELVSGVIVGNTLVGMMLTLPIFALGGEILLSLGAKQGAAATFIGGFVLAALASVTAFIGAKTRLTTYSIIIAPFGTAGAKALSALLGIAAVGWFGVTIGLLSQVVHSTLVEVASVSQPLWLYSLISGALMTGTVLFGFRAIDILNRIAVPLLALVLAWTGFRLVGEISFLDLWSTAGNASGRIGSISLGISAIVGAVAALAGGMPDLARFARSGRAAIVGCWLSFGSLSMIFMLLAGAPALSTGSPEFAANLIALGLGLPALAAVIFATWTTNIVNLYAASLSTARIFRGQQDWRLTVIAGALGTLAAILGVAQHFITLLVILGVLIPPIAGVYVVHFFVLKEAGETPDVRKFRMRAALAWASGSVVAFATSFSSFSLTTVSAVDALLASAGTYALLLAIGRLFGKSK